MLNRIIFGPNYGKDRLSRWFGLSRSAFAVIPRSMAQGMSDDWQARAAALLTELDEAYPNAPDIEFNVTCKKGGNAPRLPDALTDYRNGSVEHYR